ncbi:hypothetical protein F3Y22_tig00111105pilonHSYRG00136 [Hibiscus syriacus]|uniref:Uncharacterized protein n=1 Tax=Hibiscus syriacus TaxID=106335 RepID=A0A6A2YZ24_HIBSY|nr:hypothetical protein F3Y22_tig00111105pilonHSYRG00136 [Hibiscus syriacus]
MPSTIIIKTRVALYGIMVKALTGVLRPWRGCKGRSACFCTLAAGNCSVHFGAKWRNKNLGLTFFKFLPNGILKSSSLSPTNRARCSRIVSFPDPPSLSYPDQDTYWHTICSRAELSTKSKKERSMIPETAGGSSSLSPPSFPSD